MTYVLPPCDPAAPCLDGTFRWIARQAKDRRTAAVACRTCPVFIQCAQAALLRGEPSGVWGGLDFDDYTRNAARRERWQAEGTHRPRASIPVQPCGTPQAAKAHYRRGEKPCEPCRLAHNAYQAQNTARRRQTA